MVKNRGLTLMELIVVIAVVGIIGVVSSLYMREVIRLWDFFSFRNEVVNQGRIAMVRMAREIRQLANDTAVYTAQPARLRFEDVRAQSIDYYLSGTDLMRNSDVLATGVTALAFNYYGSSLQPLASPLVYPSATDIQSVEVAMQLRSGTESKTLNTRIFPRNLE